jgi:hypothetical protein
MHDERLSTDPATIRNSAPRRGARRARICAAVALSAATGLLATACGGSGHSSTTATTVSPERVEAAIAASVHHQRHVDASVTCPTGVPLRAQVKFYCVAQVHSQLTPFHVTETGASGHVTYAGVSASRTRMLGTAAVARAIGASIKSARGVTAVVHCPLNITMQRGLPFACTATTKSGDTHFKVRQTDGRGHVSYHAL